jgi:hypothetical protein
MKKLKAKKSSQQYFLGYGYYTADRSLVYLSLTIVALIVFPLTVILSNQDQNLSTHAAELPQYALPTATPAPPAY